MNLKESHRWVIIRLIIISILFSTIALLIDNYVWAKPMNPFYTISIWSVVIMNVIACFVFYLLSPKVDLLEDEYTEAHRFGKLSRNIYLFSILMFFTGFMTFSSTAERVSYLFFLLGLVTMPVAHILYGIWIRVMNNTK
jgi:hypothetical protein